jgi:hypothetical protein
MHRRIALSSILFWCSATLSHADTPLDFAEVHCDPVAGIATIAPKTAWDDDWPRPGELTKWLGPTSDDTRNAHTFRLLDDVDYGECRFDDGTRVRIRTGSGNFRPYGFGGGRPPVWVSAWVDRRKWVSRRAIGGMEEGRDINTSVVITRKSVTICDDPGLKTESCRSTPASELEFDVDAIEYPASGQRERAGTIRMRGADAAFCNTMVEKHEGKLGVASWQITPPASAQTEFPTASENGPRWRVPTETTYTEERFDANNDGTEDVMLSIHPVTHANDADVYFRMERERFAEAGDATHTIDDLIRSAAFVYPFGWTGCCKGIAYDPARDNDFLDAEVPFRSPREFGNGHWRPRYLHLKPFVYRGSTYFMVSTRDEWAENFTFVVRPHPDDTYDTMCRFENIVPNF